jgi:Nif-specific regulatory protein
LSSAVTTGTGDPSIASERDFYRRLLDLGTRDDLGTLLDDALGLAMAITGADVAYLELTDDDQEAPRFWRAQGLDAGALATVRTSISRGIIARAIAMGQVIETPSAQDDDRFASLGSVRKHAIQAVLCVPIGTQPPIGVLYLQGRKHPGGFTDIDRDRLECFARQLAPLADRLLGQRPDRGTVDHTEQARSRFRCPELVGRSQALSRVLEQAALVAPLDLDVLITGPSGTGKSALAAAIAANGKRAGRPFIALNCAALPDSLLESELFGAERGAHSTATRRAPGKVEAAEKGTLFLDEIGELSLAAQAKLLHLLQAHEYYPLGANAAVRADVRILAATNADLKQRVAERRFREDLYYRLHVLPIVMPALSERREDIPLIAESICAAVAQRHGFAAMSLVRRATLACREAQWPGNVRELAHAIEAGVIRAHGDDSTLVLEHHIFPLAAPSSTPAAPATFHEATRQFQQRYLLEALEANDWNVSLTSRQLDLARSHVYNLIESLKIRADKLDR